ncbi:MAG: hypothetical protein ACRYFX_26670 [Janthinobacterium lividum]
MKRSGWFWCLSVVAALILILVLLNVAFEAAYRFSRPSRVVITWPSGWGCDEFSEAYKVIRVEPSNSFMRYQHGKQDFIVPYPAGRYRDTTEFHHYYAGLVKLGQADTVIVSGHFGETISVGEGGAYGGGGGMYACDPIPYFKVQNIYSKHGKLLKHFSSGK